MPDNIDSRTSFDRPQLRIPPTATKTANTRIRPNHICSSFTSSQPAVVVPTAGPKYNAAQIANNSAAREMASLIRPRMRPTITEMIMATTMTMSMIGIGAVRVQEGYSVGIAGRF